MTPSSPEPSTELEVDHGWKQINQGTDQFHEYCEYLFSSPRILGSSLLQSITDISDASTSTDFCIVNDAAIEGISKHKARWKSLHGRSPQMLHDIIWMLGEFAYLSLRRAKLVFHATGSIDASRWIGATIACNLAIDFCKHLPAWLLVYDIYSRIKLHTLYGVCLANIGRFFESTRHFNEAQALLSKFPGAGPADLAVIELRRAEAVLTECVYITPFLSSSDWSISSDGEPQNIQAFSELHGKGKEIRIALLDGLPGGTQCSMATVRQEVHRHSDARVIFIPTRISECIRKSSPHKHPSQDAWRENAQRHLRRLYISVLDEATALLDQAELHLSGHSQSSLWWNRLYILRLRIYGLLEPLHNRAGDCLIFRKRSAEQGIFESFRNAVRIARDDPFRQYRAIKYFFEAESALCQIAPPSPLSSTPEGAKTFSDILPAARTDAETKLEQLKDRLSTESQPHREALTSDATIKETSFLGEAIISLYDAHRRASSMERT
ncbi:hypothetical protein [Rubinisphaera margarita]|uniref:hypothetical protein n=1 Tax=Rubinisphaera margarita TaxID=2909586 RepID=UPI001EE8DC4C|nr:hypothetical protein [Rubinisphaera margarita]MCG6157645.1 hypothetical protein [Rubinisphaera margarita]